MYYHKTHAEVFKSPLQSLLTTSEFLSGPLRDSDWVRLRMEYKVLTLVLFPINGRERKQLKFLNSRDSVLTQKTAVFSLITFFFFFLENYCHRPFAGISSLWKITAGSWIPLGKWGLHSKASSCLPVSSSHACLGQLQSENWDCWTGRTEFDATSQVIARC